MQLLNGECGLNWALWVLCHYGDWLEVQRKVYQKTKCHGSIVAAAAMYYFFLNSWNLWANVAFLNFWTKFLQTKYAPGKLGRLFCLSYEGKLSIATALHCINVSNSKDMLPLIGCWSVTRVWNNDIYFKEIKNHWRRWLTLILFLLDIFWSMIADDAFSSSCMLSM